VFLLGVHGFCVSPASAEINDPKNFTVAMKEYGGNIRLARIVDDRLVLPARQLRLSRRCFDLALSPDGKTLAYTHYDDSGKDFRRFIELLDVASGDVRRLTAITSNNSYNPRWSHDGRYLVASVRTMPGIWDVGVIGTDNKDFRIVSQPRRFGTDCASPIWGTGNASIYCGSISKLHEIGLHGFPIRDYSLKTLVPKAMISVPWTMDLSDDGSTMLFETELPDPEIQWHTGGRGAIYALDLSAGSARRTSPEQFSARCPAWLDANKYLFLGIPLTKKNRAVINRDGLPQDNLYLAHIDTGEVLELHKRVWEFSISSASSGDDH
jgi:dipeptidyl aminopeptidase/acylaminoacyl peptidase